MLCLLVPYTVWSQLAFGKYERVMRLKRIDGFIDPLYLEVVGVSDPTFSVPGSTVIGVHRSLPLMSSPGPTVHSLQSITLARRC